MTTIFSIAARTASALTCAASRGVSGIMTTAATIDGLAATLGTLDSKLIARIERLDERLDDQYDRVRSVDGKLEGHAAGLEETRIGDRRSAFGVQEGARPEKPEYGHMP